MSEDDREAGPAVPWSMPAGVPPGAPASSSGLGIGNPEIPLAPTRPPGPTMADMMRAPVAMPAPPPGVPMAPPMAGHMAGPMAGPMPAPMWAAHPPRPRPPRRPVSLAGLIVTNLGVVLLVLCFTAFPWLGGHEGFFGYSANFSDIRRAVELSPGAGGPPLLTQWYFIWLTWVLLAITGLCAFIANLDLDPDTGRLLRLGASLSGAAGIIVTFVVIVQIPHSSHVGFWDFIGHYRAGMWMTFIGFLVVVWGAFLSEAGRTPIGGPMLRHDYSPPA
jgi:hypothetical protein